MAKKSKKKSNKKRKITAIIEDVDDSFVNDLFPQNEEYQYNNETTLGDQNENDYQSEDHNINENYEEVYEDDNNVQSTLDEINHVNNETRIVNSNQNYSNTAGEINLNEATEKEEDIGFESNYVSGPQFRPKSMINRENAKRTRRERNGFIKPNNGDISAFDDEFDEDTVRNKCRICFHALSGHLGESVEELMKMKNDPIYKQKKSFLDKNCEKAEIFLSTFKMKYDELIAFANPFQVCANLARTWNNRIDYQKHKYLELKKISSEKTHLNDFFDNLENDLKKEPGFFLKQEDDHEDYSLDDDETDWSFLPSYIDVDDVVYHFNKCIRTDITGVLRESLFQVKSVANYIAKNSIFQNKVRKDIDDDNIEHTSQEIVINDKALFGFLTCVKVMKEVASEYRMSVKEDRSSLVFNNLALLKPIIPNVDEMKTVGLLKHSQLTNKRTQNSKTMKYQFKSGDTNGI